MKLGKERAFGTSNPLGWDTYRVRCASRRGHVATSNRGRRRDTAPRNRHRRHAHRRGVELVYVNQAFCKCTGYSKGEANGRICRFLQGPETEVASVATNVHSLWRGRDQQLQEER